MLEQVRSVTFAARLTFVIACPVFIVSVGSNF